MALGFRLKTYKKVRRRRRTPEHKGSQDQPHTSKGVKIWDIVTDSANPIVLGNKSVFELGVVIAPLAAGGKLRAGLRKI